MARKSDILTIIVAIVVAGTLPEWVLGQNCGCPPNLCCSSYGYCGTGDDYCGPGCQEGLCYTKVADIVTQEFWDRNVKPTSNCEGKEFYTREAFLGAASYFSRFGTSGSEDDNKREIAAFFAQFQRETSNFCTVDEIDGASRNYCNESSSHSQYPCAEGKHYFGRGPAKLKWNYNYGAAGDIIGFDGLKNPEILSTDKDISFKASLWFWMTNCHEPMILGQGFGVCNDAFLDVAIYHPRDPEYRASLYRNYCSQLGVDPSKIYIAGI